MIISIIAWLIFGAVIGWLAGLLVGGGEENRSIVSDVVVGLVGAVVGGMVSYLFTGTGLNGINVWSFLWALLGAILLLLIVRGVRRSARA